MLDDNRSVVFSCFRYGTVSTTAKKQLVVVTYNEITTSTVPTACACVLQVLSVHEVHVFDVPSVTHITLAFVCVVQYRHVQL